MAVCVRVYEKAMPLSIGMQLTLTYAPEPKKNPKSREGTLVLASAAGMLAFYCAVGMVYMSKIKGESGRDIVYVHVPPLSCHYDSSL